MYFSDTIRCTRFPFLMCSAQYKYSKTIWAKTAAGNDTDIGSFQFAPKIKL